MHHGGDLAPRLLEGLDADQRAAAQAVSGPVCIVAGAGTGKTRTVTYRLAYAAAVGAIDPSKALAVTHSRKAALELKERLGGLGVSRADARTFHAAGLKLARQFWSRTGRPEPEPRVLGERDEWPLWARAVSAATGADADKSQIRDVIDEIGWARSRVLTQDAYVAAAQLADRHPGVSFPVVVAAWERFEKLKRRDGMVDFADLLTLATDLIETDSEVAARVRARWAHVTVDEYQDTDPAQQRLLDAILGASADVCVVGDPRQAIYGFKGADPSYLTSFTRRYPRATVVELVRNYRSSPQILDSACQVAVQPGLRRLLATQPSGSTPTVKSLDDERGEASWVAGQIKRLVAAGTPVEQIAVLYRYNAMQLRFEAALTRAGVSTVVAEDRPFFEREEIRQVLVPFGRAARARPESNGVEMLQACLVRAGFDPDRPPDGYGAARARWESQQALLDVINALPDADHRNAQGLLGEINRMATTTSGPASAGATLATMHRAKGLEWDVVFIVGLSDGTMPSSRATTLTGLTEEERLLHVAMTRARRRLYLTWPARNSRGWTNTPSPYLDLISRTRPTTPGRRKAEPRTADGEHRGRTADSAVRSAMECPHCVSPLKGPARRLGVCADCITSVPGPTGELARALDRVIEEAATHTGIAKDRLVSPMGLLRLLAQRPRTPESIASTPGVTLDGKWARAAVDTLAG